MFLSIKENGCNSWIDVPKDVILHVIIRWNNQLWFREYACTYKKFLEVLNQSWDNNSEIIFTKKIDGCVIGLTYQSISKLTFFMKVLHFSFLNNILQHEINEKPCWTELFFIFI